VSPLNDLASLEVFGFWFQCCCTFVWPSCRSILAYDTVLSGTWCQPFEGNDDLLSLQKMEASNMFIRDSDNELPDCTLWVPSLKQRNRLFVCFLLGNSPASKFYMPTFRNTLFHPYRQVGVEWLNLRIAGVSNGRMFGSKIAWANSKEGDYWLRLFSSQIFSRWLLQLFSNLVILHLSANEDGTDGVFRNVGIYNSDAGELPSRKHTTYRKQRKFEIKKSIFLFVYDYHEEVIWA